MAVMEGASAVEAVHGPAISEARKSESHWLTPYRNRVDEMHADYERHLDARYAAARGFVDAIVHPEDTAKRSRWRSAPHCEIRDRTLVRSCSQSFRLKSEITYIDGLCQNA